MQESALAAQRQQRHAFPAAVAAVAASALHHQWQHQMGLFRGGGACGLGLPVHCHRWRHLVRTSDGNTRAWS